MTKKDSITKSVSWQLFGKMMLQGFTFFATPIFTRLMTPSDFGNASLYMSWVSIFSLLIGLQTYGSIGAARIKFGEKCLDSYLSSIMVISFLSFTIILVVAVFFKSKLSELTGLNERLLFISMIHSFVSYITSFYIARLDQLKKVERSSLLSMLVSFLSLSCSLLFIIYLPINKAEGRIYGQFLPSCVIGIILVFLICINGKCFWKKKYISFCVKLCLPLVVHGIGGLIFSQTDRLMINNLLSSDVLGVYSISYSLCDILTIIFNATNVAWVPFYFDFKKENLEKEIIRHSKRYIKVITIIFMGFILLSYDVFKFMTPGSYWYGDKIIPLLVLSFYFDFLYQFPVNYEFYMGKTKVIPIATIISAIINIFINALLIPRYGMIGAGIGTLCAHFLCFVFHFFSAKFIIRYNFEYSKTFFILPSFCMLLMCIIASFLKEFVAIRWCFAIVLGLYLLYAFYKQRSVF